MSIRTIPQRHTARFLAFTAAGLLCGLSTVGAPRGTAAPAPEVTLAAVGDVLLDRGVAAGIAKHGLGFPFQHVRGLLRAPDLTFGNLECPVTTRAFAVPKRYNFRAQPRTVACLKDAGFDVLSLANNHTMDCGREGLADTLAHLRRAGLRTCGAGANLGSAEAATVLTVKGVRVGFVGFCQFVPEGVFMRDDETTFAHTSVEAVRRSVAAARKRADVVVASFHWGVEFSEQPSKQQGVLARAAVTAGADLVLGHHPHVLQPLEVVARRGRRPALVAYSLGNFVFDQRSGPQLETIILRCTLGKSGVTRAEAVPIRIHRVQPRPATPAERKTILDRLTRLSATRKTIVQNGKVGLGD